MTDLLLDLLANAVVIGSFYALMAVGLSLIFGIMRLVNFAHGEYYMAGAYIYTFLGASLGWPLWLSLAAAIVTGAALGYVTERLLIRPLYATYSAWSDPHLRDEYGIIVTFGFSMLLVNVADKVFGSYSFFGPSLMAPHPVSLGPVVMSSQQIIAFCLAIVALSLVGAGLRWSYWGKLIQAVAQNRFGAEIGGINTKLVSCLVFMLSGALAAMAGAVLSPLVIAEPNVGAYPALKSFVVIVLGGLGSIPGAVVGGLILGIVEMAGAVFIAPDYRDSFGLLLLIAVLVLRPQGLFGQKLREV